MDQVSTVERPRRREYSADFKAMFLEQVRTPGASVAGVALSHGLNPNMVHPWMREDRQRQMLTALSEGHAFVPLQVDALSAVTGEVLSCKTPAAATPETIRMEIPRPGGTLVVHWPLSAAQQFSQLLRDWLR
ncbi:IS66-like element accessory protein TnpA [Cupriavidus necator]|nr:transposase [Cupriavidus necator]MDX6007422.1 transposase [Cupriavidus necator]